MGIDAFKEWWLNQTTEDRVEFFLHPEPALVRRPQDFVLQRAAASLIFGRYKDLTGEWIEDDRVVWIEVLLSDVKGRGAMLIHRIARQASHENLALCGEPVSLKPKSWPEDREWSGDKTTLIRWYLQQGFLLVQNKRNARLWLLPSGLDLDVTMGLSSPET